MRKPHRRALQQQVTRLSRRWRRLTLGTTRTAAVVMCLMLLCAVVVGGSHVTPFAASRLDFNRSAEGEAEDFRFGEQRLALDSLRLLEPTDYNENWLQAGPDTDRLGDVPRRHQALITPAGRLTGRIMTYADWRGNIQPLANASVHLVQHGRVAAATTTDADGRFKANGLHTGTYALVAQSPAGLLVYAVHLLKSDDPAEASEFAIRSMAATGWDTTAIVERVNEYWLSEPPLERIREPQAKLVPESVRSIEQLGIPATTLSNHKVRLQSDGRLIGRLRRLHSETGRPIIVQGIEVAIYRNGSLQGLTWTDEIGYFELPHVAPGVYSLVATGSLSTWPLPQALPTSDHGLHHGFLACGVEVLPHQTATIRPAGFADQRLLEFDAALIDVADLLPFLDPVEIPKTPVFNAPFGAGTGTTAGGGGVGGGCHLGELLVAGALAGLIPLLDDDDDSHISTNQP